MICHPDNLNIGLLKMGYRKATLLYSCAKSAEHLQSKRINKVENEG